MTLPTPESLLGSIVGVQRSLALLDAGLSSATFTVASPDGDVSVVASGSVALVSVNIRPTALPVADGGALAGKLLVACAGALSQANAAGAAQSVAAVSGYTLPGFPGASLPPPTDGGFDVTVGQVVAVATSLRESLRTRRFEAIDGPVRAVVDGALELRLLEVASPVPAGAPALAAAVMSAVNKALDRAKNLFEDTAAAVVAVAAGPGPRPRLPEFRPKALLVVENTPALRASDEALRARLSALGFQVEARKAPSAVSADANGRALIVISESVQPTDVALKFTNALVPIVAMEPGQFRDLKMTGGTAGTDNGEAVSQTQLQITPGHVLAAGLSGVVKVANTASRFEWGKPAAASVKVAAIVGKTNQWGIFAYDTGDVMVGMNAPLRRVGFFAGKDTVAALTVEGWRLFDAAVRWATAAKALITVGATPLSAADAAIKKRLEDRHGLEVLVRAATDTRTNDLGDLRVHVITGSSSATVVAARFTASPAPTINCVAALHDDLKMTGTVLNTDFGTVDAVAAVDITAPPHPLAAGLTGRATVVLPAQRLGWGKPGPEALKVATLAGLPANTSIFAYESGANMVGVRAPAPRVAFFAEGASAAAFTPAGLALFDAAVHWARRPRALLVVGALPLGAGDEALRSRLEKIFGLVVDVRLSSDAIDKQATVKRLIVISQSATSSEVGSRLTAVAIPVLALQPALFDDLKMTGATANTDFGEALNQTDVDIIKADHPLAAGLPVAKMTVVTAPAKLAWGKPGTNAVKIARVPGKTDQWTIFGYESGAAMVGANAPARRVGWFAQLATFSALNATGLRLFDAAVLWAAGRIELVPEGAGLPELIPGGGQPSVTPLWQTGVAYRIGDQVVYQGIVYRCRQAHTAQITWEPPNTYALWERIDTMGVWVAQVIYKTGDEVTFQGHRYRCIQGHQSQPDWQPPQVPTLWQRLD